MKRIGSASGIGVGSFIVALTERVSWLQSLECSCSGALELGDAIELLQHHRGEIHVDRQTICQLIERTAKLTGNRCVKVVFASDIEHQLGRQ